MRLLNGPWMTLLLLAPLIAVVGMVFFQIPTVDRANASTPTEPSNTVLPKKTADASTQWWGKQQNSSEQPGNTDSRSRQGRFNRNSPEPLRATLASASPSGADDLFESFNRNPQPAATRPNGFDPIADFERETAALNSRDRNTPPSFRPLPVNTRRHNPEAIGMAHTGGFRDVATTGGAQFNSRVDPIAQTHPRGATPSASQPAVNPASYSRDHQTQQFTWQSAIARLNGLGISEYRLEPGQRNHEFRFSCRYTPADSPRLTRLFMADAVEPLRAVEKVIAQVEQWKMLR